jgi:hypothetical protein
VSLANELEKLAEEAADFSIPLADRYKIGSRLNAALRNNLPTILSALREREAAQALPTPPLER